MGKDKSGCLVSGWAASQDAAKPQLASKVAEMGCSADVHSLQAAAKNQLASKCQQDAGWMQQRQHVVLKAALGGAARAGGE